jgi:hypothetical protein
VASTIPPVLVELQLETANIKNQMAQLNKNFADFGDTVKKQTSFLSNFKSAAVGVFAGNVMTQGLNLLKNGIQSAIVDAQAYEKVTAQLKAGIESTGNVAGLSVEGLKAHASALESISGVDENLIIQSQAVFQTFTNIRNVVGEGNDIFNQASAAALDLSVKMGGDLQGATVQLGKALNDPIKGITALTRVGVVFTDAQKAQIKSLVEAGDVMGAQKIILAEMNTEFGGAAAAAGDTFAGAVARAKDKVSDFGRELVTKLQPIILTVGKAVGDFWSKYLTPLFNWLGKNKEAVATFVVIIGTAYAAFKTYSILMGIVTTVTELYTVATVLMAGGKLADVVATGQATRAQLLLNAAMTANPIGLIVAALALLAAGFVYAWNHSETFRKVVITIAKGVVNYIAFMIRAWGGLIEIILKVVTGPMRLFLGVLQHIPGIGKYAKAGLDMINNGIEGVGDFADKVADKVQGFTKTLDGLQNKKIKIPGFGGGAEGETGTEGATAPGQTNLTPEQIAAAKASKKERDKLMKDANKDVAKGYSDMVKVITEARKKSFEVESEFNKKVLAINKQFADKKLAIEKDYADKAKKIEEDAQEKRQSVVQKSKDLLINAFQSATKLDLADLMKDSDQSGATMVQRMKAKYDQIVTLQKKAGELASLGFSQTFIQEVIAQGPDAGTAMANSILSSSPETIGEIKSLYGKIETVSETGMVKLADQMYEGMGLATSALVKEYEQVNKDFAKALSDNQAELTEALAQNQKELEDSLLDAQLAYNDAIDQIEKDTQEKLASLQKALADTAATIRELAGAKASVAALAKSPAAPILAGTNSLGLANKSSGSLVINNNTTVNGTNLADPQSTADAVSNAMRFGSTQSISPGKLRLLEQGVAF